MKYIVRLYGGLGNQMFQFAFALSLKKQNPSIPVVYDYKSLTSFGIHNGMELNKVFGLNLKQCSIRDIIPYVWPNHNKMWIRLNRFYPRRKYLIDEHSFDKFRESPNNSYYFDGFWQEEQFLKPAEREIRDKFTITDLDLRNKQMSQFIKCHNCASIHVRRGDYIEHPLYKGICSHEYYTAAIDSLNQSIRPDYYIIFSNDIDWCKRQLTRVSDKMIFVDWNKGTDSYKDLSLMSLCNSQIIANSSFSWWSAWLNKHQNKVIISPKNWTNNPEIPHPALKSWIKI